VKFSGLLKTSLIDYPNKISSVLYTPGCNLRCPFCHNWRIVLDPKPPFLQEIEALKILESRKKYIDAVVITGGEPTMHDDLPNFIMKLKKKGFQVKLDTNGFYPEVLQACLPFVDYVALDIKTTTEKYFALGAKTTIGLLCSINMLKMGKIPYEFRTTIVPKLITAEDVPQIGELLAGGNNLVLQQYNPEDTLDKAYEKIEPYSAEEIKKIAKTLEKFIKKISLRL
jgi:pyruvate formate lyase activating enzyme